MIRKPKKCEGKEYIIDETVNYLKRKAASLGLSIFRNFMFCLWTFC